MENIGVNLSDAFMSTLAVALAETGESEEINSSLVYLSSGYRILINLTVRWIEQFMKPTNIFHRSQPRNFLLNPIKEAVIEREVGYNLRTIHQRLLPATSR